MNTMYPVIVKKSLMEASEAAEDASKVFPYAVFLVIDAPRKKSRMITPFFYHRKYKELGYKPVRIYFGGKEVHGVYEIRVYDREKLCGSRCGTVIGEMVIEADLMSVPKGGYIDIYDLITGKTVYYRDKD